MEKWEQLEILEGLVEVKVSENDFLKVVETLNRIGVSSSYEKKLYPSCHILHKGGSYWILHFKHLLMLDDLPVDITEQDLARYYTICLLLQQWGLVRIINMETIRGSLDLKLIKIIPFKDKHEWTICPKFTMNKK